MPGRHRPEYSASPVPASVVMMPERGIDAAHPAVEPVCGIDIAGAIDDDAVRLVERRRCRRAAIAGIAGIAVPAIVEMIPVAASTRRMRWLNVSEKYRLPARSNAISNGPFSSASLAFPPSPANPFSPVPIAVVMIQAGIPDPQRDCFASLAMSA